MNATLLVTRDEAVHVIHEMLQTLGPQVEIVIQREDNAVTLKAQTGQPELRQWAKRMGDRYQGVFEKLAIS